MKKFIQVLLICIPKFASMVALSLNEKLGIAAASDPYFERDKHDLIEVFKSYHKEMKQYAPCAYNSPGGKPCMLISVNHGDNHECLSNNPKTPSKKDYFPGQFQRSLALKEQKPFLQERFTKSVKEYIGLGNNERIDKLRNEIISTATGFNGNFIAPKVTIDLCLVCMKDDSPVLLECGHRFCRECTNALCNMDETPGNLKCPVCIDVKISKLVDNKSRIPAGAGVRVIGLDGGGVRGVLQLLLLEEVKKRTAFGDLSTLEMWECFDLAVGTSVGSLNTVGLMLMKVPPKQLLNFTKDLPSKIFPKADKSTWRSSIAAKVSAAYKSAANVIFGRAYYDSTLLANAIDELQHSSNSELQADTPLGAVGSSYPRIAITATHSTGNKFEENWFGTIVPSKQQTERLVIIPSLVTIKEALMASCSAPTFFNYFTIPTSRGSGPRNILEKKDEKQNDTGFVFVDGGLTNNNPIHFAYNLAKEAWKDCSIDFLVSLSTGLEKSTEPVEIDAAPSNNIIQWAKKISVYATNSTKICHLMNRQLPRIASERFNDSIDQQDQQRFIEDFYFRLIDWNAGAIQLDDSDPVVLEQMCENHQKEMLLPENQKRITRLAQRLNATIYYVDTSHLGSFYILPNGKLTTTF